jgi:multimeric flavodoxin WrbA
MNNTKKVLLIIAHAPSKNLRSIVDKMLFAAHSINKDQTNPIQINYKEALLASPDDVLHSDTIILITPENLGYMSGGMKDFFDRIYYPCLEEKQGLPVCALIRAGHDGTATEIALKTIATGLRWRWVQEPLICRGEWQEDFIRQAEELATAMTIALHEGMI